MICMRKNDDDDKDEGHENWVLNSYQAPCQGHYIKVSIILYCDNHHP